jgi:hypothetical protein
MPVNGIHFRFSPKSPSPPLTIFYRHSYQISLIFSFFNCLSFFHLRHQSILELKFFIFFNRIFNNLKKDVSFLSILMPFHILIMEWSFLSIILFLSSKDIKSTWSLIILLCFFQRCIFKFFRLLISRLNKSSFCITQQDS